MYWNTGAWTQSWDVWEAEPLRPQELHTTKAPLMIHIQRAESATKDLNSRPTGSGSLFHSIETLEWLLLQTTEAKIRLSEGHCPRSMESSRRMDLRHEEVRTAEFSRSPIFVWKIILAFCEECVTVSFPGVGGSAAWWDRKSAWVMKQQHAE